jgi:hypothetical protein
MNAKTDKTENTPALAKTEPKLLSLDTLELVDELRNTVRRIEAKKHTAKTLRRTLAMVSLIIKDIESNLEVDEKGVVS